MPCGSSSSITQHNSPSAIATQHSLHSRLQLEQYSDGIAWSTSIPKTLCKLHQRTATCPRVSSNHAFGCSTQLVPKAGGTPLVMLARVPSHHDSCLSLIAKGEESRCKNCCTAEHNPVQCLVFIRHARGTYLKHCTPKQLPDDRNAPGSSA